MTAASPLSVLHGVRLLGFATGAKVAARMGLDAAATEEDLLDQQAYGRVTWSEFAGTGGWSLTGAGRTENERLLAIELDAVAGGRAAVDRVHEDFRPVNAELRAAVTDWQLRPTAADPLAANDHTDSARDAHVLARLGTIADALAGIESALVAVLPRFAGYHGRFAAALRAGRVDEQSGSCHQVWFELHEDLIATLGYVRSHSSR